MSSKNKRMTKRQFSVLLEFRQWILYIVYLHQLTCHWKFHVYDGINFKCINLSFAEWLNWKWLNCIERSVTIIVQQPWIFLDLNGTGFHGLHSKFRNDKTWCSASLYLIPDCLFFKEPCFVSYELVMMFLFSDYEFGSVKVSGP